jgi:hypothetical protein
VKKPTELAVWVSYDSDDHAWYAQGLDVDYISQGGTREQAMESFVRGLEATLRLQTTELLRLQFLVPAHESEWLDACACEKLDEVRRPLESGLTDGRFITILFLSSPRGRTRRVQDEEQISAHVRDHGFANVLAHMQTSLAVKHLQGVLSAGEITLLEQLGRAVRVALDYGL